MAALKWRKPSRSGTDELCVEVARLSARLGIRDSKSPELGYLSLPVHQAAAFLARVKSGRLDRIHRRMEALQ